MFNGGVVVKKVILFISFILATLLFFGCSDGKSVSDEYSDTYIASFRVNSDMPLFRCEVFFADEDRNRTEKIVIYDNDTGKNIQTVYLPENESFTKEPIYFKDVTFDGRQSLIVPIERSASGIYFKAYAWNKKTESFTELLSFRNIKNPAINDTEKTILSHSSSDKITFYSVFSFEKNQFVNKNSLYWEADIDNSGENIGHMVETSGEEIISDFEVGFLDYYSVDTDDERVKPYFTKGSFWDLNSEKWECSFKDCCK